MLGWIRSILMRRSADDPNLVSVAQERRRLYQRWVELHFSGEEPAKCDAVYAEYQRMNKLLEEGVEYTPRF